MRSHQGTRKQTPTKGISPNKSAPSEGRFTRNSVPGFSLPGFKTATFYTYLSLACPRQVRINKNFVVSSSEISLSVILTGVRTTSGAGVPKTRGFLLARLGVEE